MLIVNVVGTSVEATLRLPVIIMLFFQNYVEPFFTLSLCLRFNFGSKQKLGAIHAIHDMVIDENIARRIRVNVNALDTSLRYALIIASKRLTYSSITIN